MTSTETLTVTTGPLPASAKVFKPGVLHPQIRVPMREGRTLHHDVVGDFGAGRVLLRAAPAGTGIIAGGPMRAVFETLGMGDVVAKCLGTTNSHNMIKATFAALGRCVSPRQVAARRGKKVSDLLGPRRDQAPAETSAAEAPGV